MVGEWSQPVTVIARPIVTNYWFGTTVGMHYNNALGFGYWRSSNTCNLITAWRVAQILPKIKTMRNGSGGYDSTLCGLVIAMNGDRHKDRMRERAKDLGMTVDELDVELNRLELLWPKADDIYAMWVRLSESEQHEIVGLISQAIANGLVEHHTDLEICVERAQEWLHSEACQKQHEDDLIDKGHDDRPWDSLQAFLSDIGVTNLVYTVGFGDIGDPSHFDGRDIDRKIMRELIGQRGFYDQVPLMTSVKESDDESTYWSVCGKGGIVLSGTDFGGIMSPKVMFGNDVMDLTLIRYDRDAMCFLLAVRPIGVTHGDDDVFMSITQLRYAIGKKCGLGGPLEPGMKAPWAVIKKTSSEMPVDNHHKPFNWSIFNRMLRR